MMTFHNPEYKEVTSPCHKDCCYDVFFVNLSQAFVRIFFNDLCSRTAEKNFEAGTIFMLAN